MALVLGVVVMAGWASETRVRMNDLPEAVRKTVQEQTQNARVKGFSKEVENGKTYYEAETIVNGKSRDILIDSGGAVVEVEQEMAIENVPAAVRKTIETRAAPGKIKKVESVTKGSTVSYEAVIFRNGKDSEIAVNADGATIK